MSDAKLTGELLAKSMIEALYEAYISDKDRLDSLSSLKAEIDAEHIKLTSISMSKPDVIF